MCGIAALFRAFVATGGADIWECVLRDLSRRGPDSLQQICVGKNVNLAAGVLHIQVNCSKILLFGR
jgi:asparagine synthetase B (glutamine-hydrolysing)